MICQKCGAAIPDDASFCTICGEAQTLVYETSKIEQPVDATEPVKKSGEGLAIASLILGILSIVSFFGSCCVGSMFTFVAGVTSVLTGLFQIIIFVISLVGLVFAIVAKKKGCTSGVVKAGLILNIISVAMIVVAAVICLVFFLIITTVSIMPILL